MHITHRLQRLLAGNRHAAHQRFCWRRTDTGFAIGGKVLHELRQPLTVLIKIVEEKAFKIACNLYVHCWRQRLMNVSPRIATRSKKPSQYVVIISSD